MLPGGAVKQPACLNARVLLKNNAIMKSCTCELYILLACVLQCYKQTLADADRRTPYLLLPQSHGAYMVLTYNRAEFEEWPLLDPNTQACVDTRHSDFLIRFFFSGA